MLMYPPIPKQSGCCQKVTKGGGITVFSILKISNEKFLVNVVACSARMFLLPLLLPLAAIEQKSLSPFRYSFA